MQCVQLLCDQRSKTGSGSVLLSTVLECGVINCGTSKSFFNGMCCVCCRCLQNRTKVLRVLIYFLLALSIVGSLHMFISSAVSENSMNRTLKAKHHSSSLTNTPKSSNTEDNSDDVIRGRSRDEETEEQRNSDHSRWSDSLSLFGKDDVIRSGVLSKSQNVVNISKFFWGSDLRMERSVDESRKYSSAMHINSLPKVKEKGSKILFTNAKHNFFNSEESFLISQFDLCRNVSLKQHQKLVLFLIPSEPKNSLRREIIRRTWLNITRNLTHDKYVLLQLFVLGKTPDAITNPTNWRVTLQLMQLENSINGDMLVGDFIEDYWNLTYKTMFGVTYANFYCQNANYVFKVDDDVFVRPEKLVPLIDGLPQSNFFGGNCIKKGKPHRTKKSKWYISKTEYPRLRYPPFCFGPAYFFSGDITSHLFNATLELQYFKLEDVYMGLCIEKAGKTVQSVSGVSNTSPKYTYCVYKDLALAHGIEPTKWSMYYRDLTKREPQNIVCPKKTTRKSSRQLR